MDHELLYRYLRAETTTEENGRILDWLDADPEKHQKELNQTRYVYFALETCNAQVAAHPVHRLLPLRRIVKYTAGVAAVVAMLIGANYLGRERTLLDLSSRMISMEVPNGQRMKVTLEDGSQVWLNAGTQLKYPAAFGRGERRVEISGEAMFEVRHESARPFVVETFASEIEVLGTKFNVIADQTTQQFSAALLEGSIKVVATHDRETLYLKPNDLVTLVHGRLEKTSIDDPVALQWTEGIISMRGSTFQGLMSKFEKAYGVKIEIRAKTMPRLEIQSGKIRVTDGIDHALRVLQLAADFRYSREEENNLIVIE